MHGLVKPRVSLGVGLYLRCGQLKGLQGFTARRHGDNAWVRGKVTVKTPRIIQLRNQAGFQISGALAE